MLKADRPSLAESQLPVRKWWGWMGWAIALGLAILLGDFALSVVAEGFWFAKVQYFQVFTLRLVVQLGLGFLTFLASGAFLLWNLAQARREAWAVNNRPAIADPVPYPGQLRLRFLLPLTGFLSVTVGVILLYHGQVAISHWQPDLSVYSATLPIPLRFRPALVGAVFQGVRSQSWLVGSVAALVVALMIYPRRLLQIIAVLLSIGFGVIMAEHWGQILLFLRPSPYGYSDPIFNQDIGFYIFQLPVWELLNFWIVGLLALSLVSVLLVYLVSGDSLSQGWFPGFSAAQLRHLFALLGGMMLAVALSYWLDRYNLLYSANGVVYGAGYTNVAAELPIDTLLSAAALVIGLFFVGRSLLPLRFWGRRKPSRVGTTPPVQTQLSSPFSRRPAIAVTPIAPPPSASLPTPQFALFFLGLYLIAVLVGTFIVPPLVQRLVVQPNELERERPFIEYSIDLTRRAFALNEIEAETFDPQGGLTFADLLDNPLTVNNIRLWDTRPLLATNRQLQRIRLYYEFADADVDRYTLLRDEGPSERRQVLISARELDYDDVPDEAKTWVNEHLIYTHGYGFTMSPVNTAGPSGLPEYFIRGIEHIPSSEAVRRSIPIGAPRIYFGELTDTYVMTQTDVDELDYASGSDNVYNTYDGTAGINIGPYWKRLVFADHLRDWRMLLTENFRPDTRLMFRRNIRDRVQAIAPFLRFDGDPYLVVADAREDYDMEVPNYLYWIIDAYTVSDRHPYSDPLGNDFNYIRNSVKVVVDAYNGSVRFYMVDPTDPIIRAWDRIFPGMFRPIDTMPPALAEHIRYPQDYYTVQSLQLMVYHMTDPRVFYNREDQWRAPSEIYANEQQLVEPYYLLMRLPGDEQGQFLLFRPYTPAQRRNLIAWLAALSDGDRYGERILYTFPKQELVFGPEQIEARINQDPVISQQISLWNREGSRALQGNLLVIPIEESLLYVEPLYLVAEQNELPTLVRVIVAYENRIAMAPTLNAALRAVFEAEPDEESETILRSVEDLVPSTVEEAAPATEDLTPDSAPTDGLAPDLSPGDI
ncbi:MAG: UPF0182 family protein [Synechococcales bacterium]|nr:UPF0182 family protein [Synechococcales bacterium]